MTYVPRYDLELLHDKTSKNILLIPVINEGTRLTGLLTEIGILGLYDTVDVVVVDGGSTDGSINALGLSKLGVSAVIHKRGPGKLSAQLLCAYDFALKAGYDRILTIDGNGKDNPSAVPSFISLLDEGYDFVQASRFIEGGHHENTLCSRLIAVRAIHAPFLSLASGFRWTDSTQGFRGYSRRLLLDKEINIFRPVFDGYELLAYLSFIAPRKGYRCIECPSSRVYPSGDVPTKITKIKGSVELLATLFKACAGVFNNR